MPTGETREMRLLSTVIHSKTGDTLPTFLAKGRAPGDEHRSWDQIMVSINELSGEMVSTASLRKWASVYGIPENSKAMDPDEYRGAVENVTV